MFTDCSLPPPPAALINELGPMNACAWTSRSVTPTPPATPTKPPAIAGARPKTSSLDVAITTRPRKDAWTLYFWVALLNVPSGTKSNADPPSAFAFTTLSEPRNASVSFETTARPTPTKPPAIPIVISTYFDLSFAATRTLLSALRVAPPLSHLYGVATVVGVPVQAYVCTLATVTETVP